MSVVFWLDVSALGLSTLVAAALALTVLGAGLRATLNRAFALFALVEAIWALFSLILRLALWLERGDPLLLSQLAALTFALMGPVLLLFAVRYVKRPPDRVDRVAGLGVLAIALLSIPLFQGQVVVDAWLEPNGSTSIDMSLLGVLAALIPALCFAGALLLFWQERHQVREPYSFSCILILLLGLVLGGVLNLPFPIVSVTNTLGVIILGYGVVERQLFNPLRASTVELQREIYERRRVESQKEAALEALRESERFMKNVFDAIQDGISVLDRDLNVIQTNRWMEEMYAAQIPLIGKKCYGVYQDRSSPCPWCPSLLALETGQQHTEIVPYPEAEEPVGWIELTAFPLPDDDGQIVGVIEYVKDITPLRESEERHRALFEGAPDAIFLVDPDSGELLGANPAAARLLARERDEIVGLHYSQLHPPDTEEHAREIFVRHINLSQEEKVRLAVSAVLRSDGSQVPVEVRAQLVHVQGKLVLLGVFRDITERKRAESQREAALEALRRERDLVNRVMETSPVGITVVDSQGQITFANPGAERVLDLARDQIDQRTYNAPEWRITAYDGSPFPEDELPFIQVMRTGQSVFDVRHAIEWADGRRALLSINAAPLLDEAGQPDGMVATVDDVTDQMQAEQALRQSEARFRSIVESIPVGMFTYRLELDGSLVFASTNPAADEILGVDTQQFVGQTIEQAFPGLVETEVPDQYRRVAETGQSWRTDQIVYEEGQISGAFEVYAFQTVPDQMVAAFVDITERKKTEREILRLQHLLQNITDSMPSALITLDPAGRVLLWNPAAEALTGQRAEQMLGQPVWQACPQMERYRELFEQVIRKGRTVRRHKDARATNGGMVYHDVSLFPLAANDVEGAVLRVDDVTRRVQLEEMMLQSAKMASVGGLAAGVAHEINNPLGAMMQSAQMLQMALDVQQPRVRQRLERLGLDPERLADYVQERGLVDYLDGIRISGARAAKIVADLLSFSRKASSDVAPRDLNLLVKQALDLAATDYDLEKRYDFQDVEVLCEFAPGLPKIMCEGQQIQQVVLNLVRNAAQAMGEKIERGGRDYRPRLILRTSPRPGRVWLEVEDNGPGVSEALRERLFEPFFTTKAVGEGTGLGLWLCWSIVVERHKGRIWVEAGDDGGARFVVELPVAK